MTAWEEKSLYDRIIERHQKLVDERGPWNSARDDVANYTRPDIPLSVDKHGAFVGADMYEGTPAWGAQVMARGFTGNMVGRSIDWLRYMMRDLQFKGHDQVNQWLQNIQEHMLQVYRRSNFYEIMPEYVLSGVTIGSPVMIIEEDIEKGRSQCILPHYTNVWLAKNSFGEDDVLHRLVKITNKNAIAKFGGSDDLSKSIRTEILNGNHFAEHEYIHAIYAYDDPIFEDLPEKDTKYVPKNHSWAGFYILKTTDPDMKKPLLAGGYFTKPFMTWHYYRNYYEAYARTPAWFAIYDIKGSQQAFKNLIEKAEQEVRPAMWAMKNRRGRLYLRPGGKNWAENEEDYKSPPVPVFQGKGYPIESDMFDRMATSVKRWFHTDLFMMLMTWQHERKAPPTATQIAGMIGEQAVLLSAGVESFEGGVLEESDDTMFEIEQRAGRLPEPPQIVQDMGGGRIDAEFVGLLSQAQRHSALRKRQVAYGAIVPLMEINPELKYKFRWSKSAEKIAEEVGLPQDEIVPEDEYQQTLAQIRQQEQMAQAIASGVDIAKTVSELGKPVDPTSVAGQLTGVR